jgi:chromosome segregation ATPase
MQDFYTYVAKTFENESNTEKFQSLQQREIDLNTYKLHNLDRSFCEPQKELLDRFTEGIEKITNDTKGSGRRAALDFYYKSTQENITSVANNIGIRLSECKTIDGHLNAEMVPGFSAVEKLYRSVENTSNINIALSEAREISQQIQQNIDLIQENANEVVMQRLSLQENIKSAFNKVLEFNEEQYTLRKSIHHYSEEIRNFHEKLDKMFEDEIKDCIKYLENGKKMVYESQKEELNNLTEVITQKNLEKDKLEKELSNTKKSTSTNGKKLEKLQNSYKSAEGQERKAKQDLEQASRAVEIVEHLKQDIVQAQDLHKRLETEFNQAQKAEKRAALIVDLAQNEYTSSVLKAFHDKPQSISKNLSDDNIPEEKNQGHTLKYPGENKPSLTLVSDYKDTANQITDLLANLYDLE